MEISTKSGMCQASNGRAVSHGAEGNCEGALCAKFIASGQVPCAPRELNLEQDTQSSVPPESLKEAGKVTFGCISFD